MTLDALLPLAPLPPSAVRHHTDALLSEYRALRSLDDVRTTLDPLALAAAERVNDALRDFAEMAEEFVNHLAAGKSTPARLGELRRAASAARAASALSPTLMQERWQRAVDGRARLYSAEEVRGELRL